MKTLENIIVNDNNLITGWSDENTEFDYIETDITSLDQTDIDTINEMTSILESS